MVEDPSKYPSEQPAPASLTSLVVPGQSFGGCKNSSPVAMHRIINRIIESLKLEKTSKIIKSNRRQVQHMPVPIAGQVHG